MDDHIEERARQIAEQNIQDGVLNDDALNRMKAESEFWSTPEGARCLAEQERVRAEQERTLIALATARISREMGLTT